MLVLSRRVGESVCVGSGVTVRVVEAGRGRVRLAIEAPADVRIRRSELEPITAVASPLAAGAAPGLLSTAVVT